MIMIEEIRQQLNKAEVEYGEAKKKLEELEELNELKKNLRTLSREIRREKDEEKKKILEGDSKDLEREINELEKEKEKLEADKNDKWEQVKMLQGALVEFGKGEERPSKKSKLNTRGDIHYINIWETAKIYMEKDIPGAGEFIDTQDVGKKLAVVEKSKLFIRKAYTDLYNIIKEANTWSSPRIFLTGTAGMGKSCFLIYLLICLLKEKNATVIFQTEQKAYYCYDQNEIQFSKNIYEFQAQLNSIDTWYLVDSSDPQLCAATTLLSSSPKIVESRLFQSYEKRVVVTYYMTPWDCDELLTCGKEIYPTVPMNTIKVLFEKIGGVPRYVLQKVANSIVYPTSESYEKALIAVAMERVDSAINEIKDVRILMECYNEKAEYLNLSSCIFHHVPLDNYQKGSLDWASYYIQMEVMKKWKLQDFRNMLASCNFLTPDSYTGKIFEIYVIRHLYDGNCNFMTKKLTSFKLRGHKGGTKNQQNQEESGEGSALAQYQNTLHIPKLPQDSIRFLDNLLEINDTNPRLIIPCQKNFTAVDFIITPDMLFQVTTSNHHDIKHNAIVNIVKNMPAYRLNKNAAIKFYFVVPEEIYDAFPPQKLITKDNHSRQVNNNKPVVKVSDVLRNVEQWVLKVPTKYSRSD